MYGLAGKDTHTCSYIYSYIYRSRYEGRHMHWSRYEDTCNSSYADRYIGELLRGQIRTSGGFRCNLCLCMHPAINTSV
jgi:hypothetical protein